MKISLRDLFFGMACGLGLSMYFVVDLAETIDELRLENQEMYNLCLEKKYAIDDDTSDLL